MNAAKIMENCDNSILASTINTKTSSNEKTKCYANFRMEKNTGNKDKYNFDVLDYTVLESIKVYRVVIKNSEG